MHLSDQKQNSQLKIAELTSGIGALVLGIGIGAFFSEKLTSNSVLIMIFGGFSHAWGMYDKNRIEKHLKQVNVWWEKGLYWLCWILLTALSLYLIFR
jgi:hypothetical protein